MREVYCVPLVKRAARRRSEGPGSAVRVLDSRYSSMVLARGPTLVGADGNGRCARNRLHTLLRRVGIHHSHLTGRRGTLRGEICFLLCQGLDLWGDCENGSVHMEAFSGENRCCMALQLRSGAATEDTVHRHHALAVFSQSPSAPSVRRRTQKRGPTRNQSREAALRGRGLPTFAAYSQYGRDL